MLKILTRRLLLTIALLSLAVLFVVLNARPAIAQNKSINHTYGELRNQDFSEQDLIGAVFAAADLRGANFQKTNLSNSIFTKAILVDANLNAANLSSSLIDRVSLDHANLTDTIFTDAVATSTSFNNAKITGADFSGAILDRYQIALMCKRASGVNSMTGIDTRESLGCR